MRRAFKAFVAYRHSLLAESAQYAIKILKSLSHDVCLGTCALQFDRKTVTILPLNMQIDGFEGREMSAIIISQASWPCAYRALWRRRAAAEAFSSLRKYRGHQKPTAGEKLA